MESKKSVFTYRTSPETLEADVKRALEAQGTLDPREKVYIKINANYDRDWPGCNTSRWFLGALLKNMRRMGFGDVTAIEGDLKLQPAAHTVEAIGLKRVLDAYGVPFLPLEGVARDEGELPRILHNAQLINTSVLHTHTFAVISCATKNLYGLLPVYREKYHNVLSDKLIEVKESLDAAGCRTFSFIDGTVGLEGGSMRLGFVKRTDTLLAGADTLALDYIAAQVMGFPPGGIPLLRRAMDKGSVDPGAIRLGGDYAAGLPSYHFSYKPSKIAAFDHWLRRNPATRALFEYNSPMDRLAQRARRAYTAAVNDRRENIVRHGDWEAYREVYERSQA